MILYWAYALKLWTWIRDNALWLLLLVLGAAAGRKLFARKDSEVSSLKDALDVQKHQAAIENLRGRREEALKQDAASAQLEAQRSTEQLILEARIVDHKRSIVALHQKSVDVATLSDTEVEERFRDAGL